MTITLLYNKEPPSITVYHEIGTDSLCVRTSGAQGSGLI